MPDIETDALVHKAVYWPKTGEDRHAGLIVGAPVELDVRWVDRRTEEMDLAGKPTRMDVTLYVDRELTIGGLVWRGTLAEWSARLTAPDGPPAAPASIMEIYSMDTIDDLRGMETRRRARLMRYRKTLPRLPTP